MINPPTKREREVLDLLTRGYRDGQIAGAMNITINTAKAHVRNLKTKTGKTNRTRLAVWWFTRNLREHGKEL